MNSPFYEFLEKDLHDKRSSIMGYLVALLFSAAVEGEVYLIGSYARGDYDSESDIDLMITANKDNSRKIATIASKLEWTFEIPVQVISADEFDELPPEMILLYSSLHKQKGKFYYLIIYRYLINNRSTITVFNRHLNKLLAMYNGKKLGTKTFLIPLQFPLKDLLNRWKNQVELQEQLQVFVQNNK